MLEAVPLGSIALLLSPGWISSQIADSKADKGVLQCHDCSRAEEAQCRHRFFTAAPHPFENGRKSSGRRGQLPVPQPRRRYLLPRFAASLSQPARRRPLHPVWLVREFLPPHGGRLEDQQNSNTAFSGATATPP